MDNRKTERKTRKRRWTAIRMAWGEWRIARDGEVFAVIVEPAAQTAEALAHRIADALEATEGGATPCPIRAVSCNLRRLLERKGAEAEAESKKERARQ
ncbi:MAG: hypothetical protein IJS32_01175 [Kiritimatiellae bacterium]|nr:hypothetical protein [Kiritimatiellia bacterium]